MFKKVTTSVINEVKENVKEEVNNSIEKKIPFILGVITIGLIIFGQVSREEAKPVATIINNYYYFYNGRIR